MRPDTQVNGRQAVGCWELGVGCPPPTTLVRPARTVSIYLSIHPASIHASILTFRPFSPCQAAAKSALICGSPGKKFGVSMSLLRRFLLCVCVCKLGWAGVYLCLLVNLSFSFSFISFFFRPLATHLCRPLVAFVVCLCVKLRSLCLLASAAC